MKKRNQKGFTLLETLLVVAILIVLLALTFIGTGRLIKSIRQTKLDAQAQVIYTAAQNRLTDMFATGEAVRLDSDAGVGIKYDGVMEQNVQPSDWPTDGQAFSNLSTVDSDARTSAAVAALLPDGLITSEVFDKNWVVEYDATSGIVYAVFYSETQTAGSFYAGSGRDEYRQNKDKRIELGAYVGYYGGGSVYGGGTAAEELNTAIFIDNGEKLVATLSTVIPNQYAAENLTLHIKIRGKTSGKEITQDVVLSAADGGTNRSYKMILDSLEPNKSFAYQYGSGANALIPGEDIIISFTADVGNNLAHADEKSAETNSLFESVSEMQGGEQTARIAWGRHLQNLNISSSGLSYSDITELNITKAVQTRNIDFKDGAEGKWSNEDIYGTTDSGSPLKFTPINNDNLMSYDGSGLEIKGLTVDNSTGQERDSGLFGTFKGNELKGINLNGPAVYSKQYGLAGGIAGRIDAGEHATGLKVSDCHVYMTPEFTGIMATDAVDGHRWIYSERSHAGSFFGQTYGKVEIEYSSAASVISAQCESAGGFIGHSQDDININHSYADCYIRGKFAGGLIGGVSRWKNNVIDSCYTSGILLPPKASDIKPTMDSAAGFTLKQDVNITNSYTVFSLTAPPPGQSYNTYATVERGNAVNVFFANALAGANHKGTAIASSDLTTDNITDTVKIALGSAFIFDANNADWTSAYNITAGFGLTKYPYPLLKAKVIDPANPPTPPIPMRNYGDWVVDEFQSGVLAYYELYSDGSYGYYGADINKLSDKVVVEDGYAALFETDAQGANDPVAVDFNGYSLSLIKNSSNTASFTSEGKSFILRKLPSDTVINSPAVSGKYYLPISINGKRYYFNPHFAKTQIQSENEPASTPEEIGVNSARQLNMLSRYYKEYREKTVGSTFVQGRDIYYSTAAAAENNLVYHWQSAALAGGEACYTHSKGQNSIGYKQGNNDYSFRAKYDGRSRVIKGLSIKTASGNLYAGLFGAINSTGIVKNVVMVADYGRGAADANSFISHIKSSEGFSEVGYMGVIAGHNEGKIENCAAANYVIKGYAYKNSTLYFGGLVGYNSGEIRRSYSDNPDMSVEINSSNGRIGGLAGVNRGEITQSYCLGHIDVKKYKGGEVYVGGFAGNNTGYIDRAYCASASVTSGVDTENVTGFTYNVGNVVKCSYLDGGSYRYAGKIYSFNAEQGAGAAKNHYELGQLRLGGFGSATQADSKYHKLTTDSNSSETKYPYPAIVKNSDNNYIHYGEWSYDDKPGNVGLFYWEKEIEGSNNGYHFYLVSGDKNEAISTLCEAHNDGGRISEYGYGIYVKKDASVSLSSAVWGTNCSFSGKSLSTITGVSYINEAAKNNLERQFADNYSFYAFNSQDAFSQASGTTRLFINDRKPNTTVELNCNGSIYRYTFNPFFAAAISLDNPSVGGSSNAWNTKPGKPGNEYQTRSVAQLQFINWNYNNKNCSTQVNVSNKGQFNYLFETNVTGAGRQTFGGAILGDANYKDIAWKQTHDLSGDGITGYCPIASTSETSSGTGYNAVLPAWFGLSYDGQSYTIRELGFTSDSFTVGLFGVTAGASLRNIIMYSEGNAVIRRVSSSTGKQGAYALGGLVGIAYDYFNSNGSIEGTKTIENCAIAGYKISDESQNRLSPGEANVGGLIGVANVNLNRCSAVVDIDIQAMYGGATNNNNATAPWGDYVRVGGIAGANPETITNAYSGGSITINDNLVNRTGTGNERTEIYIGGIAGCGFSANYQNFTNSSNVRDGSPKFYNCYTYTDFPNQVKNIKAVCMIGSVADRYNWAKSLTINNCYYLDSCANITSTLNNADKIKMLKGDLSFMITSSNQGWYQGSSSNQFSTIHEYSYEQFTSTDGNTDFSYNLNQAGIKKNAGSGVGDSEEDKKKKEYYGSVDVTENNGLNEIHGKYSFPCGDKVLEGMDYPFPSILTQKDTFDATVHVHYGAWPKSQGLFVDRASLNLDLMSYDGVIGESSFEPDYVKEVKLYFFDGDGEGIPINPNQVNVNYENETGSNLTSGAYTSCEIGSPQGDNSIPVTITAKAVNKTENRNTAFERLTFKYTYGGTEYAAYTDVSVTATVILKATSADSGFMAKNSERVWILKAYDRKNREITGLNPRNAINGSGNWFVLQNNYLQFLAQNPASQPTEKINGENVFRAKAIVTGETSVYFDCLDIPVLQHRLHLDDNSVPDSNFRINANRHAVPLEIIEVTNHTLTLNYGQISAQTDEYIVNSTMSSLPEYVKPVIGGYRLDGWFTELNDGVKVIEADGTVAAGDVTGYITGGRFDLSGDKTLYAHWSRYYKLTLKTQQYAGGEKVINYFPGDGGYESYVYEEPARAGWEFAGWYVQPDKTEKIEINADNVTYGGAVYSITGDTELIAKWRKQSNVFRNVSSLSAGDEILIVSELGSATVKMLTDSSGSAVSSDVRMYRGWDSELTNLKYDDGSSMYSGSYYVKEEESGVSEAKLNVIRYDNNNMQLRNGSGNYLRINREWIWSAAYYNYYMSFSPYDNDETRLSVSNNGLRFRNYGRWYIQYRYNHPTLFHLSQTNDNEVKWLKKETVYETEFN